MVAEGIDKHEVSYIHVSINMSALYLAEVLVAAQDNPLQGSAEMKGIPILTLDVWEHAYYLKYNASRPLYIKNWWAARLSFVQWSSASRHCKIFVLQACSTLSACRLGASYLIGDACLSMMRVVSSMINALISDACGVCLRAYTACDCNSAA